MSTKFCNNCGPQPDGEYSYCMNCGSLLKNVEQSSLFDNEPLIECETQVQQTQQPEQPINIAPVQMKKASYCREIIIFVMALLCFLASLTVFIFKNTDIDFTKPLMNSEKITVQNEAEIIPELTPEMAAELLNCADVFPYHYFEAKGMLDKSTYIPFPGIEEYAHEIPCYPVKGIETKEDYFEYFERYATADFVRKYFDNTMYYHEENSNIYFLPNEFAGYYGYSADALAVEKIDDKTYFVVDTWLVREYIIIYIDGSFKVSLNDPKQAVNKNTDPDAYIYLPDVQNMTLAQAEEALAREGLTLDYNNITYVASFADNDMVVLCKNKYKRVKQGEAVGVYVARNPSY